MSAAKHTPTPMDALLERLKADGGRYLLSVALTREERDAQPLPTFGNKGRSRWLTEDERARLCAALEACNSHDALVAALEKARDELKNHTVNDAGARNEDVITALVDIGAVLKASQVPHE